MILQFKLESQIDNLVTLIGTKDINVARNLGSLEEVQIAYRSFIEKLQKRSLDGLPGQVNIITDLDAARRLRPLFINDSLLDDKDQEQVIAIEDDCRARQKASLITQALAEITIRCPQHSALFETIITDIFILPSSVAKGGSTSQAIGVIWANPRVDYCVHDVMEMLLHELTHHMLFLDELRYGHYDYEVIANESSWATSAILNISRPLDKVLHSVVVSTEILLLRQQYLGHPEHPRVHPPTSIMLRQLEGSVVSMEAILNAQYSSCRKAFLPRAIDILDAVKKQINFLKDAKIHFSSSENSSFSTVN